MGRLAGKVALITGATSGIGEATAEVFAEEGAQVAVVGRSAARGEAVAQRIGGGAFFLAADVSREADIERAVAAVVDRWGRLDVLFNNAGASTPGRLESFTQERFQGAMDLLLGSVLFGMKHAAPVMRAQGRGAIINNTSVAALRAGLSFYLYSIAKAAVTHATKVAATELGRHGITVNCISPGAIVTPIFFPGGADGDVSAEATEQVARRLANQTPVLRAGLPRDVAYAALYLASEEASYINGLDLVVDGGMMAGHQTDYSRPGAFA